MNGINERPPGPDKASDRSTILVVDDNPLNLKLAVTVMECAGYRVEQAISAEDALTAIARSPPDLMLLDIALPGMDGLTLTRKLRADPATRHLRIVAMTAFAMKGDEQKAIDAGCNGYITKPIDTRRLPAQVEEHLRPFKGGCRNILIVDDLETNRILLRINLRGEGLNVIEASDGAEALAILERQPIDAIISDILMPTIDGYRLCYEVRRNPRFKSLPFIFYTNTYTSLHDETLAKELGADRFITKPASFRVLLDALQAGSAAVPRPAPPGPLPPELEVMKNYSARLVAKLEERNAELQRATEELRESEEKLRDVFDNAHDLILVLDPEGRLLYFNPALKSTLGYSDTELRARHFLDLVHRDGREACEEAFARMIAGTPTAKVSIQFAAKDGRTIVVEGNCTCSFNGAQRTAVRGIFRDVTERNNADAALRDSRERLARLSRELLTAQETERRTLARELHDEIGQVLTAVNLALQQVLPHASDIGRAHIDESLKIVNRAIQQTRNLALNLRPNILDDFGLLPALRWYLDRQRELGSAEIEFDADTTGEPIPPQVSTACYRLIQEAVTNVQRHAQAKHVRVGLKQVDNGVEVAVEDDGVGFDVEAHRGTTGAENSLGLITMRERVELLGGRFELRSTPGKGSAVTAYVPIQ